MGKCNSYVCRQEREALTARVRQLEGALETERKRKLMWRKHYDEELALSGTLRRQIADLRAALTERKI
jgi:hypothetical protein